MVGVVIFDLLYAKFIDDEGEIDGAPVMPPVSWCDSALAVSCFVMAFGEEVLHNDAGLQEAVHSTLHFIENIAILIRFVTECVFC